METIEEQTREQYERLIKLLMKDNELKDKTIRVLEKQVEVLEGMLKIERSRNDRGVHAC